MPRMATRVRTKKTADTAPATQEETPDMTVTDDVYEPETATADEPAKRGRKADPLVTAVNELKAAKAALEVSRKAVPLDQAEARYEAAKAEAAKQMEL